MEAIAADLVCVSLRSSGLEVDESSSLLGLNTQTRTQPG